MGDQMYSALRYRNIGPNRGGRVVAVAGDPDDVTRFYFGSTGGGVITSAGLILAGTFGALMTLPLRDLFQLGFAVAIGVLMDTFITRSLLVPSLVNLLGKWNWWPSRAAREASPTDRPEPSPAEK